MFQSIVIILYSRQQCVRVPWVPILVTRVTASLHYVLTIQARLLVVPHCDSNLTLPDTNVLEQFFMCLLTAYISVFELVRIQSIYNWVFVSLN